MHSLALLMVYAKRIILDSVPHGWKKSLVEIGGLVTLETIGTSSESVFGTYLWHLVGPEYQGGLLVAATLVGT